MLGSRWLCPLAAQCGQKSFAAFCSPTFLLPLTSSKQQNAAAYSCTLRGFVLLCGALILLLSPKDERFELVVTSDV